MTKPKPSGQIEDYKNIEKWDYERWAWEFLRRNTEFRKECDRVKNLDQAEKDAVANKFHLKKLKRYNESYRGESGKPKFLPASIISYTHDHSLEKSVQKRIRSKPGQVIIVFDLNKAIDEDRFLAKQLLNAKKRLENRLKALKELKEITGKNTHKPQSKKFGLYIRLIDLLKANKNDKIKAAASLYPDKHILTKEDARQELGKHIQEALVYVNSNYVYLASLSGKPGGHPIEIDFK
jgi:hypothetical protein